MEYLYGRETALSTHLHTATILVPSLSLSWTRVSGWLSRNRTTSSYSSEHILLNRRLKVSISHNGLDGLYCQTSQVTIKHKQKRICQKRVLTKITYPYKPTLLPKTRCNHLSLSGTGKLTFRSTFSQISGSLRVVAVLPSSGSRRVGAAPSTCLC